MSISIELVITLFGILANAAVTFGVVTTRIEWLRSDLRKVTRRLERIEAWALRAGHRPHEWGGDETAPGELG